MAAANASARGQRAALLTTPLRDLAGFILAVDCGTAGCRGERTYTVADLATSYGAQRTVGEVLRRMRCGHGCGAPVASAWLATGPVLNARFRPRRTALRGPDARD